MRIVKYVDKEGYLHLVQIKDEDPDSMAKYGVPVVFPDMETFDWDGFKRDLYNSLLEAEFYTIEDVMKAANAFAPALTVLKRYLTAWYMSERG